MLIFYIHAQQCEIYALDMVVYLKIRATLSGSLFIIRSMEHFYGPLRVSGSLLLVSLI